MRARVPPVPLHPTPPPSSQQIRAARCVVSKGGMDGFLGTQNWMPINVNMKQFSPESKSADLVRVLKRLLGKVVS